MWDHYYYGPMMGGFGFGFHALWWLFWIVVVVALLFWRRGDGGAGRGQPRETPHEILRRRLAHGEISVEEYESRKAVLDRDRS